MVSPWCVLEQIKVTRRLFSYNKWESVKSVLLGLGRLNITHLIMLRKINFYRHAFSQKITFCVPFLRHF